MKWRAVTTGNILKTCASCSSSFHYHVLRIRRIAGCKLKLIQKLSEADKSEVRS